MKVIFLILGFGFLGASFLLIPAAEKETRLTDAHWTCQPPNEMTGDVDCATSAPRSVKLELGPLMYTFCLAMTGVGCLVAAAAVGSRGSGSPAPASPLAPAGPGPVPPQQPFAPPGPPRPAPGAPYGR
jgi:hypothetical protein